MVERPVTLNHLFILLHILIFVFALAFINLEACTYNNIQKNAMKQNKYWWIEFIVKMAVTLTLCPANYGRRQFARTCVLN